VVTHRVKTYGKYVKKKRKKKVKVFRYKPDVVLVVSGG
jgi:hypothetical protein